MRARLAVVALLITCTGCLQASPSPEAYKGRTTVVLGDAISEVETTRLVLQQASDGRVTGNFAVATVRASDDSLSAAIDAYGQLYPQHEVDQVHKDTTAVLGDAGDLVEEARIALYRRDEASYPKLAEQLKKVSTQLENLEKRLS